MAFSQFSGSLPVKVSFELFPPNSDMAEQGLLKTINRLSKLSPEFVSVTYGAGGSTRERTLSTIRNIKKYTSLDIAAHLTCVDATRDEIDEVIREFQSLGVNRFVALRGDPSGGVGEQYVAMPDGYANGAELVSGLKAISDFDVTVSAYPEKHPESADLSTDLDMLKRKVDNGATRAITQYFFDNDLFERYLERVRRAGIYIPIIPGILPIHNFTKVANFSARCGTHIPQWLADRFDGLDDDPATRSLVAAAIAAEQVDNLVYRGVTDFHFYTMNKAELVIAICRLLGINEKIPVGSIAA